jgi:glycosyltransferase involved in cell wall biosynthesis
MKILFVANEYTIHGKPTTGFPAYLFRISQALIKMGHIPIIVAGGRKDAHSYDNNIEVWTVKVDYKSYKTSWLEKLINDIRLGFALNKKVSWIIRKEHIDIIQFTSISGTSLFYHGMTPAVMRLSSYAKTYFSSYKTLDRNTVKTMALIERISAHNCNAIYAPCKITADAFGSDIGRKVSVIETPFENDVKQSDDKYVKTYLENKKYVLFFGTLYAEKGVLVIAEILKEFLQMNKDYYFVFVGEPCKIDGKDVRKIILDSAIPVKKRILVMKSLPHKQLYPIIQNADFVVLPSLMDNFPNACIEAMYFGKVVIGTDGASFEQLIDNGVNGFLCKIDDSQDLLCKMNRAVKLNAYEKRKMCEKAHERIELLRPEIAVKKLLRFYQYVAETSINS